MKHHKYVEKRVDVYDVDYSALVDIEPFKSLLSGLVEGEVTWSLWDREWVVHGWRPMTEKERASADRKAEAAKRATEAKKLKAEERELREYERLKKKYG